MAKFTVLIKSCCNCKNFSLFNPTAKSVKGSLFLKNLEKHFCDLTYKKKNFVKHIENLPQHLSENLTAINYRLPISLKEIEMYRLSVSPRAFLKLSIIASVQKGLSCPSLTTSKFAGFKCSPRCPFSV